MSVHTLPTTEEVAVSVDTLTPDQKNILDRVVKVVLDDTPTIFYLEAPGTETTVPFTYFICAHNSIRCRGVWKNISDQSDP